jgi:uncharacterized protein
MDRNCHVGSERSSPPNEGPRKKLGIVELCIYDRGFNDPFPTKRCLRQSVLGLRLAPVTMAALYVAAVLLLCIPKLGLAFNFPPLTGRAVDQAGIMNTQSRSELEGKLQNLENKSGIQLVVATVKSLEGSDIETYANQLFRNWKLGEAKKNSGVLLLVAPNEHKVRIEVGYGLEGTLTDALSSVIISSAIVPRFKANDFSGGIERGVDGIINVLSGDTADWQPKPSVRAEDPAPLSNEIFTVLFVIIAIFVMWSLIRSARGTPSGRYTRGGPIIFLPPRRCTGLVGMGWGLWWRWRRVWRRLFGWRRLVGWWRRLRQLVMN